jgi:hypothetical protein
VHAATGVPSPSAFSAFAPGAYQPQADYTAMWPWRGAVSQQGCAVAVAAWLRE